MDRILAFPGNLSKILASFFRSLSEDETRTLRLADACIEFHTQGNLTIFC